MIGDDLFVFGRQPTRLAFQTGDDPPERFLEVDVRDGFGFFAWRPKVPLH